MAKESIFAPLRPSRLFPALSAGLIAGVITVVISLSFAVLIFRDVMSPFLPEAVGLALFSAVVVTAVVAALSSYGGSIAIPQDKIAPILAVISSSLIAQMVDAEPRQVFLTTVATLTVAALLTGFLLSFLGWLKLGGLIRFIPFPVVGGFLAGTGFLLAKGALSVMTGLHLGLGTLVDLFALGALLKWLPGLVFAVALLWLTRRFQHFLIMPAVLACAFGLFFAVLKLIGMSMSEAQAGGWLLGPFPVGGPWRPLSLEAFAGADWGMVLGEAGNLGTVLVVASVAVLLTASALELAAERDMDLNRELKTAGAANLLVGLGGGMVGFHVLSLSGLVLKMGVRSRIAGFTASLVCVAVLMAGTQVLSYFPTPVLGGLLMYLGLSFLAEWVYDTWYKLSRPDYFVIVLILAFVAIFGFLEAVGVGILACVVLFSVNYSQVRVVKEELSGLDYQSNVERPMRHSRLLREHGGQICALRLQGFIFFGTANRLLEVVRARVANKKSDAMRYLLLDFSRVTGVDSSSVLSFIKIRQLAAREEFAVVLVHLPSDIRERLRREGLYAKRPDRLEEFADLDHGFEWCEEEILAAHQTDHNAADDVLESQLVDVFGTSQAAQSFLGFLERLEVEKGAYIIREDDEPNDLYLVESGRVTVQINLAGEDTLRFKTMGAGAVVGEMGLYLGQQRSASVVADDLTVAYRLTSTALNKMQETAPALAAAFHTHMVRLLAERLIYANRTIRAVLE